MRGHLRTQVWVLQEICTRVQSDGTATAGGASSALRRSQEPRMSVLGS